MNKKLEALAFTADIDGLYSLFGGTGGDGSEIVEGLLAMGEFARRKRFFWTLFIVGRDLANPDIARVLRGLLNEGHEIACHSMTHPQNFRFLSREEKLSELKDFVSASEKALEYRPSGFRSPGWNVSLDTGDLLLECGYRYDSSVFPTLLAPVLKCLHRRAMRKAPDEKKTTLGPLTFVMAPRGPYRTRRLRLDSRGDDGVWEFPIPVTPGLRLPFFATYHLRRGYEVFYRDLQSLAAERGLLHYQFHLMDFISGEDDKWKKHIPREPGIYVPETLKKPLDIKMKLWERIVDTLTASSERLTRLCDEVPA